MQQIDAAPQQNLTSRPSAVQAWCVRLGLETGGPGWSVQGPPAPLSPTAELALLAVRQLRSELAADMATLNIDIGKTIGPLDPIAAKRASFRAAASASESSSKAPGDFRRRKRTPLRWIGGRIEASA